MSTITSDNTNFRFYYQSVVNHPIVNHPVSKFLLSSAVNIVAIRLSGLFCLHFAGIISRSLPPACKTQVYSSVVTAPIIEETLFRGMLQKTIEWGQKGYSRFVVKKEPSEGDLKAQQIFRIRITALLFGAVHLLNPHQFFLEKIMVFAVTTLLGISYGYLAEKYQSIAPSIIAHSLHNGLCEYLEHRESLTIISELTSVIGVAILYLMDYSWYALATDKPFPFKASRINAKAEV